MLYIKRKTQVKPTTGTIIDSASIKDKKKNTYSARVIDNKENATKQNLESIMNTKISNSENNIFNLIGLGSTQLTRSGNVDIDTLDLNGFVYLSGANQAGTAISNGYLYQLTYTNIYKVQFMINATGTANFRYRRMLNGTWEAWVTIK